MPKRPRKAAIPRRQLEDAINAIAPSQLALDWDNVGLLVSGAERITGVLCSLDINPGVVNEAVRKGANAIVAHHPLIFHPLKHLREEDDVQRTVAAAIRADINCFAAHTNLDAAREGCNATLAKLIGLQHARVLQAESTDGWRKIAVFVPSEAVDRVRSAMARAGAGTIGEYTECSFEVVGEGTFRPSDTAKPYNGSSGKLSRELEIRLEVLVVESQVREVVRAMVASHPYEEVAYDIYVLDNPGTPSGVLWCGELKQPLSPTAFAEQVKRGLGTRTVRAAFGKRKIRTVALCSGAGGSFIQKWHSPVADAYVTGDVSYHAMQHATALGMTVLDPGHGPTEQPAIRALTKQLARALPDIPVTTARTSTDPVRFV